METAERREEVSGRAEEQPARCPNCGTPAPENYCPHCGQKQKERVVSTRLLLTEWADHYLGLDARLAQTLRPLFLRPGALTQAYLTGRRKRFSRPARVYLAASLVFFFALSVTNTGLPGLIYQSPEEAAEQAAPDSLSRQTAQAVTDSLENAGIRISDEGIQVRDSATGTYVDIERPDEDRLAASFIENLPTLMFILLPVFALLLKLLYVRRRRYYIEHLVFALHTHAFAFLLLTGVVLAGVVLSERIADHVGTVVTLGILFYGYCALRRVYGQPPGKTAAKLLLLFFSYAFVLLIGFVATVALAYFLTQM